ncbi:MAG: hypothetical protein K8L97_26250 [Anaerolineae bacterium]|nr:hypothetical protein [Anaerolineae bacterium]
MSDQTAYPCPCCQIGFCQPGTQTYLRMHNGLLVSVPDVPMWTCDICQYQEFDQERLRSLDALLGVNDTAQEIGRTNPKVMPSDSADAPDSAKTIRRMKP